MSSLRWLAILPLPAVAFVAGLERADASAVATAAPRVHTAIVVDSLQAERDSLMNVVLAAIRGREQEPAEQVFKNIEVLRGMPADAAINCTTCHRGATEPARNLP
ncbi:MAG: hypothetical protein KF709_05210 [Gemmatimonadaceae bacterium]|nr:hypothetical protein [Gemmatimonadaceae bacterium]